MGKEEPIIIVREAQKAESMQKPKTTDVGQR